MIAREASRTYTKLKANVAKDISNTDQMKTCEAVLIKKKIRFYFLLSIFANLP